MLELKCLHLIYVSSLVITSYSILLSFDMHVMSVLSKNGYRMKVIESGWIGSKANRKG